MHSLGKTLLVFALFILHSKAKPVCYSSCFLTSYFCIPVPYNEKDIFWVLVLQGLVGLHAAAKSLQLSPTLCDPIDGSPPVSPIPWDSPGKNTEVGCHFPLQCMKVKGESKVAQSCLTLSDPMDCSLSGSSIHGIHQARVLECGAIAFSSRSS